MIGSRKKVISGSHIFEIADKKTAYNEGRLYMGRQIVLYCVLWVVNYQTLRTTAVEDIRSKFLAFILSHFAEIS